MLGGLANMTGCLYIYNSKLYIECFFKHQQYTVYRKLIRSIYAKRLHSWSSFENACKFDRCNQGKIKCSQVIFSADGMCENKKYHIIHQMALHIIGNKYAHQHHLVATMTHFSHSHIQSAKNITWEYFILPHPHWTFLHAVSKDEWQCNFLYTSIYFYISFYRWHNCNT